MEVVKGAFWGASRANNRGAKKATAVGHIISGDVYFYDPYYNGVRLHPAPQARGENHLQCIDKKAPYREVYLTGFNTKLLV